MSKSYIRFTELARNFGITSYWADDDIITPIKCVWISIVVMLESNHSTSLETGAVKVKFVEMRYTAGSEHILFHEEVTPDHLLKTLVSKLVSVSPGHVSFRSIQGGRTMSGNFPIVAEFIGDPMSHIPDELRERLLKGLANKCKSINKNFRNYDNKKNKRDKDRKARAISSMSESLAKLDPTMCDIAISAMKASQGRTGQIINLMETLEKFVQNVHNWHDDEVMEEAKNLASVKFTMNQ